VGERIRQREQRRASEAAAEAPPEPTPINQAVDELSEERQSYVRDLIDYELQRRRFDREAEGAEREVAVAESRAEVDADRDWLRWLQELRDLPAEDFAKQRAELDERMAEQWDTAATAGGNRD